MKAAIVIRYGRPHPGREKLAFEAFGEALGFFGAKATAGACAAPLPYMAPGGGMIIVHGERDGLLALVGSEEYQRVFLKAGFAGTRPVLRGHPGRGGRRRLDGPVGGRRL